MDETRKRYVAAGIIVGAVTIGLAVLARRTPRDQWGETLRRIATDAVGLVKARYGSSEPIAIVERTLDNLKDAGEGETTLSRAFSDAVAHSGKKS